MRTAKWKSIIALLLVVAFVGTSALASEYEAQPIHPPANQEVSGGAILADVVLIRPVSFVGLVLGSATWLVAAPLSAIADGKKGFKKTTRVLIQDPFHYTFNRSMGVHETHDY